MSEMILTLTKKEVLALRRFRNNNDTSVIKGLLQRLLDSDIEGFEETEASEELRLRVAADRRLMAILFDSTLNMESENEV